MSRIKPVNRFAAGAARAVDHNDSLALAAALNSHGKENWMSAIVEEIAALRKINKLELVERPSDRPAVNFKCVLRKKHNPDLSFKIYGTIGNLWECGL